MMSGTQERKTKGSNWAMVEEGVQRERRKGTQGSRMANAVQSGRAMYKSESKMRRVYGEMKITTRKITNDNEQEVKSKQGKKKEKKKRGETRSLEWAPNLLTQAEDGPFTGSEEINVDEMEDDRRRRKRERKRSRRGWKAWNGKGREQGDNGEGEDGCGMDASQLQGNRDRQRRLTDGRPFPKNASRNNSGTARNQRTQQGKKIKIITTIIIHGEKKDF